MSFLDSIQTMKSKLKPTDTFVTYADGQKYCEGRLSIKKISQNVCGYVVDTKPDNIPAKIVDHLYLGSQDCCEINVLRKYCINNVLSVGIDAPIKYSDITYKFVECLDLPETNLEKSLLECLPFMETVIEERKENILVHCNAGVSRSASVVIGYLIIKHKLSFAEAYKVVKEVRECVKPNIGFETQLCKLFSIYDGVLVRNAYFDK